MNTTITGEQIRDGSVKREDLNITIANHSVILKVLQDANNIITISGTGADSGTGDVTLTHATGNGYNHIPKDGVLGDVLIWDSLGTPTWSSIATGVIGVASETDYGVIKIATIEEAILGEDDFKAITPLKMLSALTLSYMPYYGATGDFYTTFDITTTSTINAPTINLTNLTDGYVPYHKSDLLGLVDSPIITDGQSVTIKRSISGTTSLSILPYGTTGARSASFLYIGGTDALDALGIHFMTNGTSKVFTGRPYNSGNPVDNLFIVGANTILSTASLVINTTTGVTSIPTNVVSTTVLTGALTVAGGVGVNGKVSTLNAMITSGAATNYLAVSDASGNLIWTDPDAYFNTITNVPTLQEVLRSGNISGDKDIALIKSFARIALGPQGADGDVSIGSSGIGVPPAGLQDYGFYTAHNAYRNADGNWYHSRPSVIGAVRFTGGAGGSSGTTGFRWDYNTNVGAAAIPWTNLMALTIAGNLGIGTTNPLTKLDINSDTSLIYRNGIQFDIPITINQNRWLRFSQSALNFSLQGYGYGGGVNAPVSDTNISLQPSGGNVGIGTTTPLYKLEVAGNLMSTTATFTTGKAANTIATGDVNGLLTWSPQSGIKLSSFNNDLTTYVPYTGATTNVNLGSRSLSADILSANKITGVMNAINSVTNNFGNPTIEEMALIHGEMNNKLRFIPPILQEESTDGTTYTTSTRMSANTLADMMIGEGQRTEVNVIPAQTIGVTGAAYRLTWDATVSGYVFLNKFYVYCNTAGNYITITVERRDFTTQVWSTLATGTVNNWPGHIYIPHTSTPFQSSGAGKYDQMRVTFKITTTINVNPFTIYAIEWFGSYPQGRRNVESYDRLKNVQFPGSITTANSNFIAPTVNSFLQLVGGTSGMGGYLQGTNNSSTTAGYGLWLNNNAYWNGSNWIQPRGTATASYLFSPNLHAGFTWRYAGAGGVNDNVITPVELMNLNSNGFLDIKGLNGLPNTSGIYQTGALRVGYAGGNVKLDMGSSSTGVTWIQATNSADLSLKYPLLLNPNGGNVSVGNLMPNSRFNVTVDNTLANGFSLSTSDFVAANTGSALSLRFGAVTGSTYSVIEARKAGNSQYGDLVLNPTGGNVGIGIIPVSGGARLTVSSTDQTSEFLSGATVSSMSGRAFLVGVNGENYSRTVFYSSGAIGIGPGNVTRDTFIGRSAVNTFRIGSSYDLTGSADLIVNGNVGIGTIAPDAILDVSKSTSGGVGGIIQITNPAVDVAGNAVELRFAPAFSHNIRYASIQGINNGGNIIDLVFITGAGGIITEKMRIKGTGNIGIGNVAPNTILSVNVPYVQDILDPIITAQNGASTLGGMYGVKDGTLTQYGLSFKTYKVSAGLIESLKISNGGIVTIPSVVVSSSTITGSLIVGGGIGISGAGYFSGDLYSLPLVSTNPSLLTSVGGVITKIADGTSGLFLTTNGTGGYTWASPSLDGNTTYTFTTGTANGTFNVTPSGGSLQAVSIYGLGSLAYSSATYDNYSYWTLQGSGANSSNITSGAVVNITGTGATTVTKAAGNGTITIDSTNTTYSTFVRGANGLVPSPGGALITRFLREDGTWQVPIDTDTTYSTFGRSINGLVPAPGGALSTRYLREDGVWQVPTDNNTTYTFATGTTNGTFNVTPLGGSVQVVSIFGLGSLAYSSATYDNYNHWTLKANNYVATYFDVVAGGSVNFIGAGLSAASSDGLGNLTITTTHPTYPPITYTGTTPPAAGSGNAVVHSMVVDATGHVTSITGGYLDYASTNTAGVVKVDGSTVIINATTGVISATGGATDTAASILTKLLTVDGTGTGLDADLLDGNHATAFALATHGDHGLALHVATHPAPTIRDVRNQVAGSYATPTDVSTAVSNAASGYVKNNTTNPSDTFSLMTFVKNIALTTMWQNTGILNTALPTGLYAFTVSGSDYAVGGNYDESYAGQVYWYDSYTNNTEGDEIILHSNGQAKNNKTIFLRTKRNTGGGARQSFEICANYTNTTSSVYTFKFRRII